MKIYVAGPMKGYAEDNFPAFHRTTEGIRKLGHQVICPSESFGGDGTMPVAVYARYDIHALLQVDAVCLLPDWERSTGACTEVTIGLWLGLEFFYFDEKSGELHPFTPERPIDCFMVKNGRHL